MPTLDRASFEDCYRRVFPLVLAKCRRMLRGDADAMDVTQEVFVRLWRHRELVQDQAALTAWLYRTSTRLVIDRARQRALGQESLRHLVMALEEPTGVDSEARFSSRRQLRSVLSDCPPSELEAAILSRLDRLTHPEIAEVVGVGERTVRRLLGRFDERVSALKELSG
jgi:RNA polymerase sigma-70 factor (ECF subfamily)